MDALAQIKKQVIYALFLIIINLTTLVLGLFFPVHWLVPAVAAQSTGDTLPTRPPTPPPTLIPARTPSLTPTPERKIWVARLVSNTLGFTLGQGSIFRVKVEGIVGALIELRSDDELITGLSGSKPEYGPYTAEFAPVTEGTWLVSVPSLGLSIPVPADNYNLAVIEFIQVPVSEATPQVDTPAPTPTPLGGYIWKGQLVSETQGPVVALSRLLVQVTGLSNHPVRLSTAADIINTANTGQKPDELGPDVVEFTGLTPAKYFIEPLGLNSRFEVELKPNVETRVKFQPLLPPTVTPAPPAPPTSTPTFTITATPTDTPTPTLTPAPTDTAMPVPSPTSVTQWLGAVEERSDVGNEPSSLIVKIPGIEGLSVQLRTASNSLDLRRCITGQGGEGQDSCAFKGLTPGQYVVSPEGLGLSLPVTIFANEKVKVTFDLQILPPGITGWQAQLIKNTNQPQAVPRAEATIRVRVNGRTGQVIALRSTRGLERLCEVVPNPVLGSLVCEFGQLNPGVYLVEALNTGAGQRLFVDGMGLAEIEFSPTASYAIQAVAQSSAVVGQGAQPDRLLVIETPPPIQLVATRPMPRPTSTLTSTTVPTPAFAWQGRIVETVNYVAGAIGVRAAGLKDHPVILHSGGWQSPVQLTGSKVELGEYATEFGGLAQGEYIVELVDLAELRVNLGPDQFILVEFRYDFVDMP